jgi:hypothetical protein
MDVYLGRCLKNWAAWQQSLARTQMLEREQLLWMAASSACPTETRGLRWLLLEWLDCLKGDLQDPRVFLPFTQTQLWSFHMTKTFHMVA